MLAEHSERFEQLAEISGQRYGQGASPIPQTLPSIGAQAVKSRARHRNCQQVIRENGHGYFEANMVSHFLNGVEG
jgi:hypothetical protein